MGLFNTFMPVLLSRKYLVNVSFPVFKITLCYIITSTTSLPNIHINALEENHCQYVSPIAVMQLSS
jgi:hypothetical protein